MLADDEVASLLAAVPAEAERRGRFVPGSPDGGPADFGCDGGGPRPMTARLR